MPTDSTSTVTATTTIFKTITTAADAPQTFSTVNGISTSAYASAAPSQLFNQVTNIYSHQAQSHSAIFPRLLSISTALKCALGALVVGGVTAAVVWHRISPEDVSVGEDPRTWKDKLEYACRFLKDTAAENGRLREAIDLANQRLARAQEVVNEADAERDEAWLDYDKQEDTIEKLELVRVYEVRVYDKEVEDEQKKRRQLARQLKKEIEDRESSEMNFDIQFATMQASEKRLQNEKDQAVSQLDTAHKDLKALRKQLGDVRSERDNLSRALGEARNEPNALKEQLQLKLGEQKKLRDWVEHAEAKANELVEQIQVLQNEINTLKGQDVNMYDYDLDGELEETHQHADGLQGILQQQYDIIERKDAALEQRDAALRHARQHADRLQSMLEQKNNIIVQKNADLQQKDMEAQKASIAELEKFNAEQKNLEDKLAAIATELDEERLKRENLEARTEKLTDTLMDTVAERDEERHRRESVEAEVERLTALLSLPTPQHPQPRLNLRRSSQGATILSEDNSEATSCGSQKNLPVTMCTSNAHKSPFLDIPPSLSTSVLQATNGEETTVQTGDPSSSQHQEQAGHSLTGFFISHAIQQGFQAPGTPVVSASQDMAASSPQASTVSEDTPSKKRPRAQEGESLNEDDSPRIKRSRRIAPRKSIPATITNEAEKDAESSLSSSQVPVLDLTNIPTFLHPNAGQAAVAQNSAPALPVPATPAAATRRTSRLPVAPTPTTAASGRSRRTNVKPHNYNEAVLTARFSPEKAGELPAPAASSQQSDRRARARAGSPTTSTAKGGRKASPSKSAGVKKR